MLFEVKNRGKPDDIKDRIRHGSQIIRMEAQWMRGTEYAN